MAHEVPFLVAELGSDVNPFVLHLFAALAQKERALISTPAGLYRGFDALLRIRETASGP